MKYPKPQGEKLTDDDWLRFILAELQEDQDYRGTYRSAAAAEVSLLFCRLEWLREQVQSQAKELRRMERRNVKLQQKITRLMKRQRWNQTK